MDAKLDERSLVDQQVEPLAGGQFLPLVLLGDLLRATALPDLLAPRLEVLGERAEQAGGGGIGGHRKK